MVTLNFLPFGGPGKKHRKTDRMSSSAMVIGVTLDQKYGLIQKPAADGNPLFISLDERDRGNSHLRLYQMEGAVSKDQREPRPTGQVKRMGGIHDPILLFTAPRDDRIKIHL